MSDQSHLPDSLPTNLDEMLALLSSLNLDELTDDEFSRLEAHLAFIADQMRDDVEALRHEAEELEIHCAILESQRRDHEHEIAEWEAKLSLWYRELDEVKLRLYTARLYLRTHSAQLYANYAHVSGGTANPKAKFFDNSEPPEMYLDLEM